MTAIMQKISNIFPTPPFVNRLKVYFKTRKLVSFPDQRNIYLSKKYENLAKDIRSLVGESISRSAKKARVESPRWSVEILESNGGTFNYTLQGGNILVGAFTLDLKMKKITTMTPDGKEHVYPAKQDAYAIRMLSLAIENMPESKKSVGLF